MRDNHVITLITRPEHHLSQPLDQDHDDEVVDAQIFVRGALADLANIDPEHQRGCSQFSKRRHASARANLGSNGNELASTNPSNFKFNPKFLPTNPYQSINRSTGQSINRMGGEKAAVIPSIKDTGLAIGGSRYSTGKPIFRSITDQSLGTRDHSTVDWSMQKLIKRRPSWDPIEPSAFARDTINPIRRLVDVMNVDPNPEKPLVKLHIGDPSITGVLPTHPKVAEAVQNALNSGTFNGYGPAIGFQEVRRQLADHMNRENGHERPVQADDIILTSGCSHALQIAIEVLAGPGQNILVPKPGFPLYTTLMQPHGIESRFYPLLIDRDWEADLERMESLIDDRTAAIVVNNPNNPTGAVYGRRHLEEILRLAEKHRVPIIADEIYGDMVYGGARFHPMYTLMPKVPVLTCDGISKRYLVPGWRLGWLVFHDNNSNNCLINVRKAAQQLAQKIVGPCSLMQGALPSILADTPRTFFDYNRSVLAENVSIVCRELADVPGLTPIRARGAMYIMIGVDPETFPEFQRLSPQDPVAIMASRLIAEESVYCLPGSAFNYPRAIRLVTTHQFDTTVEACRRLKEFCHRHYRPYKSEETEGNDGTDDVAVSVRFVEEVEKECFVDLGVQLAQEIGVMREN